VHIMQPRQPVELLPIEGGERRIGRRGIQVGDRENAHDAGQAP
jgi:hypothetical protein